VRRVIARIVFQPYPQMVGLCPVRDVRYLPYGDPTQWAQKPLNA